MKIKALVFFIFLLALSCHAQDRDLTQGSWLICGGMGLPLENYEFASPYHKNYLTFSGDSVRLESGFFYRTETSENIIKGKNSFVYYGKEEMYKVSGDSLLIYSSPYKKWHAFKLDWINDNELHLTSKLKTLLLYRKDEQLKQTGQCRIEYIKARVINGPMSIFGLNYSVIISDDNFLSYRDYDSQNKYVSGYETFLDSNAYEEICRGFNRVDLEGIKSAYKTDNPEKNLIYLEIALKNGKLIKTELQNSNFPDELRQALVPVIYAHQKYVFGDLPPIE